MSPILTRSMLCVQGKGDGEQAESTKSYIAGLIPASRIGQAEEIAKAVQFLASDEASFVNGVELFVDGGQAQI